MINKITVTKIPPPPQEQFVSITMTESQSRFVKYCLLYYAGRLSRFGVAASFTAIANSIPGDENDWDVSKF